MPFCWLATRLSLPTAISSNVALRTPHPFKKVSKLAGDWKEVMDGDSYSPTDPDDVKLRPPMASGLLLSRVTSAPEPRRADGPFLPSLDHTPRKRESPVDRPYQRSIVELSSPSTQHFWHSGGSSPRGDGAEPPDKRPRLDYIPEKLEAEADSLRSRMDPYVRVNGPASSRRNSSESVPLTASPDADQSLCLPARASSASTTPRRRFCIPLAHRIVR